MLDGFSLDPLKRVAINLHATGPAAVLCVLFICITCVGIFGVGPLAGSAIGMLGFALGILGVSLASAIRPP